MLIGCEVTNSNDLLISYYNKEGNIDYIIKRLNESDLFNWVESNVPTKVKSWNNKFVTKKYTNPKYIYRLRIEELILEKLTNDELEKIYSNFYPKKYYLDIEIKLINDSFPDPEKAEMPVGMISFCDENNNVYILSIMTSELYPNGLSKEHIEKMEKEIFNYFNNTIPLTQNDKKLFERYYKIKYIQFENEEKLLNFYFEKILPKKSFITGWNVIDFDWKYLMNRSLNLKIDPFLNLASKKNFSKSKIPLHLGILDYMQVFQEIKPYKTVENYKLNYISNLVLNVSKLKSNYQTMFDFQKDVYTFTMYNIIDVILVKLIEDKLSLFDVAYSMSHIAKVEINKIFSPVHIAEILICREFLNQGKKMPKIDYDSNLKDRDTTYIGAYVRKPNPDYYKYIFCYDFSSMYPNIQIQFNISPDTYLGKIDKVKLKSNEIVTKNKTVFRNDIDSVTRKILTRFYDERIKKQKEIEILKNS